VDAVVSGVGVATFRATASSSAPATLSIHTQPSSSAQNGVRLGRQPVIQVQDAGGHDVAAAGIVITAQIGSGGGDLGGTRQRSTDGSGRATFTDLVISGAPGKRILVFTASGFAGATSTEIDLGPVSTVTTITSDSPDPSLAGAAVTVEFRVSSGGATPVGSVTVSDGGVSCSGALSGGAGSCQLALTAIGQRTLEASYSGAPGFSGSSDSEGHRVDAVPTPNQPPTAGFTVSCTDLHCNFTDGSSDGDGRIDSRSWTFGDDGSDDEQNPAHDYAAAGTYTVALTVTDDDGATGSTSQPVTVTAPPAPNQPPQAQGDAYTTDEDAPLTVNAPGVLANDTDPEGNTLSAVNPGSPSHGTLALASNGSFLYTPNADYSGSDSFTYQASDGSALSGQAVVNITVNPVNDPPVAQPDAYEVQAGGSPLTVSAPGVLGNDNDPEGDVLTASLAIGSNPQHGTLVFNSDGSFTYTPEAGFSGPDSFDYAAHDGSLNSNTQTVAITVNAPPPAETSPLGFRTGGSELAIERVTVSAAISTGASSLGRPSSWAPDRKGRAKFSAVE
jgi:VCBS repeat-containing protein